MICNTYMSFAMMFLLLFARLQRVLFLWWWGDSLFIYHWPLKPKTYQLLLLWVHDLNSILNMYATNTSFSCFRCIALRLMTLCPMSSLTNLIAVLHGITAFATSQAFFALIWSSTAQSTPICRFYWNTSNVGIWFWGSFGMFQVELNSVEVSHWVPLKLLLEYIGWPINHYREHQAVVDVIRVDICGKWVNIRQWWS